jgi:predicted DNA binding CopG/RHH family protein
MADFTPITTQEEFDRAITDRIKRERETLSKKYADYDELKERNATYEKQLGELKSSLEESTKKTSEYEKTVADLTGKISSYELTSLKTRIAHEMGIPYELAGRLTGDDEKSLRADAESFSKLVTTGKSTPPLKSTEPSGDGKDAEYKKLLNGLKGE